MLMSPTTQSVRQRPRHSCTKCAMPAAGLRDDIWKSPKQRKKIATVIGCYRPVRYNVELDLSFDLSISFFGLRWKIHLMCCQLLTPSHRQLMWMFTAMSMENMSFESLINHPNFINFPWLSPYFSYWCVLRREWMGCWGLLG